MTGVQSCQPEIELVRIMREKPYRSAAETEDQAKLRRQAERERAADRIEELTGLARFLLDRLAEFDPNDYDAARDFHGHVCPAIARLASALSLEEEKSHD